MHKKSPGSERRSVNLFVEGLTLFFLTPLLLLGGFFILTYAILYMLFAKSPEDNRK